MREAETIARKLVFINRFFFPDHSATSQILSDLAFDLATKGHNVTIVTSRQRYDSSTADLPSSDTINSVNVVRVWTSKFGRDSLLGRAIDYLTFYITTSLVLFKLVDRNTTVIAKTDPPLISVVAAIIVRLKRGKMVNWLQDLFPEVANALGVRFVLGPAFTFLRYIRNKSLLIAEYNIVIGDVMANHLRAEGIPIEKIRVLSNWADGSAIKPLDHANNPLRKEWGLQDKFVVGYSGNIGRAHEFLTIIQAAKLLKRNEKIVFLFIGGGAQRGMIENSAIEEDLDSILFKPYQPRGNLRESLACADVHLVSLNPKLEGLIVPSKIYGVLAAGRPSLFIGDSGGEVSRILLNNKCGFPVAPGNGEDLAEKIVTYLENPNFCKEHSKNAHLIFQEKYQKAVCIKGFVDIFNLLGHS